MRFSLRTMISGALSSSRRRNRLLRLMTRRYRSLRSEVANRPPSSGTSGRRVRRQYRQHRQDHVLGAVTRFKKRFDQLDPLGQPLDLGLRVGRSDILAQLGKLGRKVDILQQIEDRLGTHLGVEFVAVGFHGFEILLVGQKLPALQRRHARIKNQIGLEIQNPLYIAQGHVQHQADAAGQGFQNQMCATGLARSIWPMRSRRTLVRVTSVPHFSHFTPRCFMRLYLPHRHS